MNVEIWSDVACPWCFIGKRRFERALAQFSHRDDVTVTWRSFQLDPSLPERYEGTEAQYLAQRKGLRIDKVRRSHAHVSGLAAAEGLAYDFDRIVVANSARAHELIQLAKERGVADPVEEALFSAHFEHGEDIGSQDLLVRVGEAAGLDGSEVKDALATGRYRAAVQADIAAAAEAGAPGVPYFLADGRYALSGAQPVEVFALLLERAWDARRIA